MLASCPSAYNKDLQEDKEPVFDAAHQLRVALEVARGVLTTTEIHPERMREPCVLSPAMLATDLAEHLVRKHNVPFRETHHVAGAAVRLAEKENTSLAGLSKARTPTATLHPAFENDSDADVAALWDLTGRRSRGRAGRHIHQSPEGAGRGVIGVARERTQNDGPLPNSARRGARDVFLSGALSSRRTWRSIV